MTADAEERGDGLAPEPDFRHVTLAPSAAEARARAQWPGSCALALLGVAPVLGFREAAGVSVVAGAAVIAVALRTFQARRAAAAPGARPVAMSIVPWGVIVDEGAATRILRWSAISRIDVHTTYGRDQATDFTKGSLVIVETREARLAGRANDAVPLERLLAHREAYAREAAHVAAIDLDGERPAGESWEPQAERLLLASRELVRGAGGRDAYRGRAALAAEDVAVRLRAILRDRTDRELDPRPLGALLAAELGLAALATDVAQLSASPHPLTAAVARAAGAALGVPKSRLGVLDEVAPFLPEGDVDALSAWTELRSRQSLG